MLTCFRVEGLIPAAVYWHFRTLVCVYIQQNRFKVLFVNLRSAVGRCYHHFQPFAKLKLNRYLL